MRCRINIFLFVMMMCQATMAQIHVTFSDIDRWTVDSLAPYVGKTVIFDNPMVVCDNANGIKVSTRRLYTPTNQALPNSAEYLTIKSLNSIGSVTLNGVENGYHRCGEKIYNLKTKVTSISNLDYIDGDWHGNTQADLEAMDIHEMVGTAGCDSCLVVCTYNIENYSAGTTTKRKKIISALKKVDADVYGLVEVNGNMATRNELVTYLNEALPERQYKVCSEKDQKESNQIAICIYDSKKIKHLGFVYFNDKRTSNRKKLYFLEQVADKESFIFSVNHFKAKSGSGTGANADMNDGQGGWNADRQEEAQSVIDSYKNWSGSTGEKDILIMGDLNSYGKEDPIRVLADNGMIDLHRAFHADSSYSYRYLSREPDLVGYLDHALCSSTMRAQVTGMMAFHINSDENYSSSSNTSMFRGSDHDPIVVGLRLNGAAYYDPSPKINNVEILTGEADKLIIRDAYSETQKSFYAIYDINGHLISKEQITNELFEVALPQASGFYIVYVYHNGQAYQNRMVVR